MLQSQIPKPGEAHLAAASERLPECNQEQGATVGVTSQYLQTTCCARWYLEKLNYTPKQKCFTTDAQ